MDRSMPWVRVAAVVMAGLLLTGCTGGSVSIDSAPTPTSVPPSSTATAEFVPGADGIGDSYYPKAGNGGYDVANYDLALRYEPASDLLIGSVTITATATAGLSRFNLDLRALTVSKVTVDGAVATSRAVGDELTVTPRKGIPNGSTFVVALEYSGKPKAYEDEGLGKIGFLHTVDGAFAIGQPEVAASWFPVNDHPRDKATYTIAVTAPDGLAALANGELKGKRSAAGWTTWTWNETTPMASYLATVVIGRYRVTQSRHDGLPVVFAVDASLPTSVDAQLVRTTAVVDFLETKFGPYPFDTIGGIVLSDSRIRFALENQSRPLYGPSFFLDGNDGTWVIVHELAHQWYGDSVSVNDWREIWLNEGFATYAEWLWSEENGAASAQVMFDRLYAQGQSPIWSVPPGDPGRGAMFHQSVYQRGAMTLHALRRTIGDSAFFRLLQQWAEQRANRSVTTVEFIALAEQVSGSQLDALFQDWLYQPDRPARPTS